MSSEACELPAITLLTVNNAKSAALLSDEPLKDGLTDSTMPSDEPRETTGLTCPA